MMTALSVTFPYSFRKELILLMRKFHKTSRFGNSTCYAVS